MNRPWFSDLGQSQFKFFNVGFVDVQDFRRFLTRNTRIIRWWKRGFRLRRAIDIHTDVVIARWKRPKVKPIIFIGQVPLAAELVQLLNVEPNSNDLNVR